MAAACPTCAAVDGKRIRLRVVTTRANRATNCIVRFRKCPTCGTGVQTVEQPVAVRPAGARPAPLVVSAAAG